jgi:hypothetical protein
LTASQAFSQLNYGPDILFAKSTKLYCECV